MVMQRALSRRDFIKLSGGSVAALGMLLYGFPNFRQLFAEAAQEVPVIWLQAGTCTGCSVSVLNTLSPKIQNVLVDQVIPGKHFSLRYHATVMAGAGDLAMKAIEDAARVKGGYLLIMEGAVATRDGGVYCEIGEKDGEGITALEHLEKLGRDAMAVVALGTCATNGGIPAAEPNPTGCKGVRDIFADKGIDTPVINLPGCPPHPDWVIGTVATVLIGGLGAVEMDAEGRPLAFYENLIHDLCPRRSFYDTGQFAKKFSDPYCLFPLGCKGPVSYADCPTRLWNSGTSWCIGASHPCIGCVHPGFPDAVSPIYRMVAVPIPTPTPTPTPTPIPITPTPTLMPTPTPMPAPAGVSSAAAVGIGIGGAAVGAGAAAGVAYALGKGRERESGSDSEQSSEER
ncbi:MAG: hydrogenase small subunit [Chloroflexota bacterium]